MNMIIKKLFKSIQSNGAQRRICDKIRIWIQYDTAEESSSTGCFPVSILSTIFCAWKFFLFFYRINYTIFSKMRLNSLIPNFSARTTIGPIQFYDWQGDAYVFTSNQINCILWHFAWKRWKFSTFIAIKFMFRKSLQSHKTLLKRTLCCPFSSYQNWLHLCT